MSLFTCILAEVIEDPKVLLCMWVISINISVFKIKTKKHLKYYCKVSILLVVFLCTFKKSFRLQNNDFLGANEANEIIVDITMVEIVRKKREVASKMYLFIL